MSLNSSSKSVNRTEIVTESLRTLDRLLLRVHLADTEIAKRGAKILEIVESLEVVEVDSIVLDRAASPMPTELGTLDAIHLASALLWKESTQAELTMATHDTALGLVARAHGLAVIAVSGLA